MTIWHDCSEIFQAIETEGYHPQQRLEVSGGAQVDSDLDDEVLLQVVTFRKRKNGLPSGHRSTRHPSACIIHCPNGFSAYSSILANPAPIRPARREVLASGWSLRSRQSIWSDNGLAILIMQPDGDVVVYRTCDYKAIWSTGISSQFYLPKTLEIGEEDYEDMSDDDEVAAHVPASAESAENIPVILDLTDWLRSDLVEDRPDLE
ncbi:hypothetical protein BV898_17149 [Hypsibius exemplaris]|uniref:Bulb-type lectin domain-containing protein n=1 Tax=Hypsibius exemplaris TaxID=2072580 RepID=A0A9X6NH71_HYPEX|nr:hypothetical protein BV898_17149 [Hypsibius exemplaris]